MVGLVAKASHAGTVEDIARGVRLLLALRRLGAEGPAGAAAVRQQAVQQHQPQPQAQQGAPHLLVHFHPQVDTAAAPPAHIVRHFLK